MNLTIEQEEKWTRHSSMSLSLPGNEGVTVDRQQTAASAVDMGGNWHFWYLLVSMSLDTSKCKPTKHQTIKQRNSLPIAFYCQLIKIGINYRALLRFLPLRSFTETAKAPSCFRLESHPESIQPADRVMCNSFSRLDWTTQWICWKWSIGKHFKHQMTRPECCSSTAQFHLSMPCAAFASTNGEFNEEIIERKNIAL